MSHGYSDESMIHRIEDHVEDLEKDVKMLSSSHMSHESAEGLEELNLFISPEFHTQSHKSHSGGNPMMYPYSCGTGGFGAGFLGGVLGGQLFRHGGYNYGGDGCGSDGLRGGSTLSYLVGRDNGLEAKTSDVVAATASISETVRTTGAAVINNLNALDSKLNAQGIAMFQGFAGVDRGLCDNRHAADLQFAMLSKDMALQHCAIEKHVSCEAEKTRAMLAEQNNMRYEDKLEALRFQMNEVQRQRDLLATGNFPISQQVNIEKCHGHSHHDDIAIQINNVNQQVAAIGSTVAQLGGALQSLLQK